MTLAEHTILLFEFKIFLVVVVNKDTGGVNTGNQISSYLPAHGMEVMGNLRYFRYEISIPFLKRNFTTMSYFS